MSLPFLQDVIHKVEVAGGSRIFRVALTVLVLIVVTGGYNLRAFRNLSTQEAMDAAQLARNISEGKGYSTLFIRPLSIFLVKKVNEQKKGKGSPDAAELKQMHPDLANPPLYPVLLAGMMKVLPLDYRIRLEGQPSFWNLRGRFYRYQPDFIIGLFNQCLFLLMVFLLFRLARKLFDSAVAWVSSVLIVATELFWHFTVSGLSTILLLLIFVALCWCVVLLEEEARVPKPGDGRKFALAALAGACIGAGCLTRYAFGWLIIPLVVFLAAFGGRRRVLLALLSLIVFGALVLPWVGRNWAISGTPFGTSTYTIIETTFLSQGDRLQRTLEPAFNNLSLLPFWIKLMSNLRQIVQEDLPKMGGSWVSAFFLVGLLIGFRSPALNRLRYFILLCLPVLILAQALGHTQLSEDSPVINSENLLVIVAPLILLYGVGLFFVLVDQLALPVPQIRYVVILAFGFVSSLPMILLFLPPKTNPVAYPPYDPPTIQRVADWVEPSELTMSDLPWAMAWYGHRQSAWLTLRSLRDPSDPENHEDFLAINDYLKAIGLLYLTPRTMDAPFYSDWIAPGEFSWENLILNGVKTGIPSSFPLYKTPRGLIPGGQLVLADKERWNSKR